jgi:hypothetical protein
MHPILSDSSCSLTGNPLLHACFAPMPPVPSHALPLDVLVLVLVLRVLA